MLKSLLHWKVLVNLLLAAAIFIGLVWLTFRWLEFHTNHGKEIPVPNVMNMSVHNAIKVLDDAGLAYEVDSFNYDPKYRPFQVLQIYPSAGSRVKDGRTVVLKVNPRTWAPVQVPDVIDRYKGLAFRQLERVGLKVGDTIFEPSIQRDAVIRMLYNGSVVKPGARLPRFSAVDLVIGAGPRRNISIPNVVGLTVAEAKAIIANNLFEIGLVEYEDGKGDDSDVVYYQDPAAGDLRDQGMQVDLWASKKTPAELRSKVAYLNSIYRVKIDTTLPPVRYEEIPNYQEPQYIPREPEPQPAPVQKQETKVEAPKVTEPSKIQRPAANSGATVKPGTKSTPAETKPKSNPVIQQPVEKPKAKKLVVE